MDAKSQESISVSRGELLELLEKVLRAEILNVRPLIEEQLRRSLDLVDEEGGIAMLPMQGKDPRRTFRRLMNAHGVEYVRIGKFKWWKRSAIAALIEKQTVKRKPRMDTNKHEFAGRIAA